MLCRVAIDDHPDSRTPRSSEARHRDAKTVSERNLRDQGCGACGNCLHWCLANLDLKNNWE
jgi:hypothetical protein